MVKIKDKSKFTWGTFKSELFKGKDIKKVQAEIIAAASKAGLFAPGTHTVTVSRYITKLEESERKNMLAQLYLHAVKGFLAGKLDIEQRRGKRVKWGISFKKVTPAYLKEDLSEVYTTIKVQQYGFTRDTTFITDSEFFSKSLTLSIEAFHKLGSRSLRGWGAINMVLTLLNSLHTAATRVVEQTQEEELLKYYSDEFEEEEVFVFPYKLFTRLNQALNIIYEIKPNVSDKELNEINKIESNYLNIKNDIEQADRLLPKTEAGSLVFQVAQYEAWRQKWETLATTSLNIIPSIATSIMDKMKKLSQDE